MKLELVKKYELDNIQSFISCVVLNDETSISLIIDDNDNYALLFIGLEEMRYLPLNYLETFLKTDDRPVLFSKGGGFGIIKNQNELFYYQTIDINPIKIEIENKKFFQQILPAKTRLGYPNPISNNDILPVCFQHTVFSGNEVRYFAFLNLNIEKQKAKWESWTNLETKRLLAHHDEKNPPKIDSIMTKGENVFIFTSGGQITSVNKWGMDYYGIVKTTKKGEIVETILDSGNLHLIDQKKRGVNGVFSSSQKFAFLTPVFQSDEWKGKQKLFALESKELLDINFPRGVGKYPQIVEHSENYFWIYLRDTKHIAICREVQADK